MLINDASITGSLIVNASASLQNILLGGNIIPDETNLRNLGSTDKYFKEIYVSTGSINFVDDGNIVAILNKETLDALQNNTASANIRLNAIESVSASLQSFTASISTTNTFTSSATARLNALETSSASVDTLNTNQNSRLGSLETISASNISRITALETTSASVDTLNTTQNNRLSALETTSASVDTLNTTQNTRLSNLEIKTGSLATTGSNTFIGTQTITGSLFISANLVVQGTSSLENITASAVSIGTNIVNLNTANPAIRYAGLVIGDSGSIGSSGSFLYDSVQDELIFVHRGTNTTVTSSVVLMGPQTYDSVGNETYPTLNIIQKGTGNEHLGDSNISDNGTLVSINSITSSFSGIVGIGTTSPDRLLHINGNTSTTTPLQKVQNTGIGDAVTEYRVTGVSWYTGIDNSDSGKFKIGQDPLGTTDRFIIADGGNIGIGVTSLVSPGGSRRLLQISNSTSGALIALGSSTSESNNPRIFSGQYDLGFAAGVTTGNIDFYTNDQLRLTIACTGASTFSTGANTSIIISNDSVDTGYNIVSLNGTRTKGSYAGIAGGGTGDNRLYLNSGVDVVVQTGASYTERMRISSGGLVTVTGTGAGANSEGIFFKRTSNLAQGGYISGNGGVLNIVATNEQSSANGIVYFQRYNGTSTTTSMVINSDGNVGIGTTSPPSKLSVQWDKSTLFAGAAIYDSQAFNTSNHGGTLAFGGTFNSAGTYTEWSAIGGMKSNTTDGNVSGDINFYTRLNSSAMTERMRIDSGGTVQVRSGNELRAYRSDNARYGTFYTDNNAVHIAASVDPVRISTPERTEFYANGLERMRINSDGTIAFGVTTPFDTNLVWKTDFTGTVHGRIFATGAPRVVVVAGESNGVQLTSGATSWTSNSDERLKDVNCEIENAVEKLSTLRTIHFTWKADKFKKENLGLIAQDVEKQFPQLIDKAELAITVEGEQKDETQYLGIRYTELIPVLVKAIQELKSENDTLKSRIEILENK